MIADPSDKQHGAESKAPDAVAPAPGARTVHQAGERELYLTTRDAGQLGTMPRFTSR